MPTDCRDTGQQRPRGPGTVRVLPCPAPGGARAGRGETKEDEDQSRLVGSQSGDDSPVLELAQPQARLKSITGRDASSRLSRLSPPKSVPQKYGAKGFQRGVKRMIIIVSDFFLTLKYLILYI